MFQFTGLALSRYHFMVPGFPIRKSSDQSLCAATRSLSQLIASFIASESQGIHRLPLLTFLIKIVSILETTLCIYFQYFKEL
jgi:hypothetical protein